MPSDPYVRVYYRFKDDHPTIYNDDRLLAAWLRLLILADGVYPASAPLPRWLRKSILADLLATGAVELVLGDSYRIHGLAKEREGRSQQARDAAAERWRNAGADAGSNADPVSGSNADASEPLMPNKAEPAKQSKAEPSQHVPSIAPADEEPEFEARQWLMRHGCLVQEGNGFHRQLVVLVDKFGINAVIGKFDRLAKAGVLDGDTSGFVYGAKDALYPKPNLKALDAEDRKDDEAKVTRLRQEQTRRHIDNMRQYEEAES